jgi:hypothetical protein
MSKRNAPSLSSSSNSRDENEESDQIIYPSPHPDLPDYWKAPAMENNVPLPVFSPVSFNNCQQRRGIRISWFQYIGLWAALCLLALIIFVWMTVALQKADTGLFGTFLGSPNPIVMTNYVQPIQPININPHIFIGAVDAEMAVTSSAIVEHNPTATPVVITIIVVSSASTSTIDSNSSSRSVSTKMVIVPVQLNLLLGICPLQSQFHLPVSRET